MCVAFFYGVFFLCCILLSDSLSLQKTQVILCNIEKNEFGFASLLRTSIVGYLFYSIFPIKS